MTLETGLASRHRSKAGFTLLEIIIVFALITLASGVIITNFTAFLDFDEKINPEDSLRSAIRSARFQAASNRSVVTLIYDDEAGTLVVGGGESFQLNSNFGREGRGEIRFYLVPPAEGYGSVSGCQKQPNGNKKTQLCP